MSAFVAILDRSGETLDPGELRRLAEPLSTYGTEVATFCRGPVGIAVRHRGGPDARRRHGPLVDPGTGRAMAVAGRFREVAESARSESPAAGAADLLARGAYPGPDLLARLSGPFTLLVADPGEGSIEIARDPLGSHKVYYFLDGRRLVAASEASAVLAHDAVPDDLDEGSVARFLGFRFGHTEASFFRRVRELPPAHRLRVTADDARTERYWRFRRLRPAVGPSEEEIARDFVRRLERAVADETADLEPGRVALSLSGGLDSTAVAAVAPRGVRAFSWTFDEEPKGDERAAIEAVARHLTRNGTRHGTRPVHWVRGDGLHPLAGDFAERFVHRSSPYLNAFAALKCRLYEAAREAGCERVLVGDGGDALYAAREYWLRDALAAGRPWALRSLAATARRAGRGDRLAQASLARVVAPRGLRSRLRGGPPWLTPEGRAALTEPVPSPILPPGRRRRARYELVAGTKHTEIESEERRLFALCGVERGNPFWSWPLLEWALGLPAHWYQRDDRSKVLTREALRGRLPEGVLEAPRRGLLGSFFLRGIELRREEILETVFRRPRSNWQRYVRREWVEAYLAATGEIAFGHTILWRVIGYELWSRRLAGEGWP